MCARAWRWSLCGGGSLHARRQRYAQAAGTRVQSCEPPAAAAAAAAARVGALAHPQGVTHPSLPAACTPPLHEGASAGTTLLAGTLACPHTLRCPAAAVPPRAHMRVAGQLIARDCCPRGGWGACRVPLAPAMGGGPRVFRQRMPSPWEALQFLRSAVPTLPQHRLPSSDWPTPFARQAPHHGGRHQPAAQSAAGAGPRAAGLPPVNPSRFQASARACAQEGGGARSGARGVGGS